MIIEYIIFLGIFIGAIATGVISTWGWIKSDTKKEDLHYEIKVLQTQVNGLSRENAKLKAEISFYKNELEEKKNGKQ